jgi:hypothetical protein
MSASDRIPTRLAVDYGNSQAEVELPSGLVLISPLSGRGAEHDGEIGRTDYDPETSQQTITFHWGETATFEIGPVAGPGVPVVYLDQNQWVMLACQQWSPGKVPEAHRDGYARLMTLARERAIVLPLSAAHAIESARKDGRQRRELAATMLQLSRGWQMRSPLKVRREELLCNIAGFNGRPHEYRQRPPFTLDPYALFSTSDYAGKDSAAADLHARLAWAPALAETLIEDEREEDEVARAKGERWAALHAGIAARMAEANPSPEEKWATARMALVADLTDEMSAASATAGLDRREWEEWLAESESNFASMPAIARVQQVTHQRLSNPQCPWRVNDFTDMHFLACAAGYANFVLAEKATSHHLRRAERGVPSGARICRSAGELADLIEEGRQAESLGQQALRIPADPSRVDLADSP